MKTRTACLIIPVNIIAASERKLRPDVLEAFKGVSSRSNKTVKLKFFFTSTALCGNISAEIYRIKMIY